MLSSAERMNSTLAQCLCTYCSKNHEKTQKQKYHNNTRTTGGLCVTIPVTYVPQCPSFWEIRLPIKIHKVSLDKFISRTIHVEWPGFGVINKLTRKNLKISINKCKA